MIPWKGDVVKLNPEIDIDNYCRILRGLLVHDKEMLVKDIEIRDDYNYVSVYFDKGNSFGIRLPEGRFYATNVGSLSLFVLERGDEEHPFSENTQYPVPVPGDKVLLENHSILSRGTYFIEACNCNGCSKGNYWPHGEMRCGAHIQDQSVICYNPSQKGWTCDGILYRTNNPVQQKQIVKIDLKILNTKIGSTKCARCGGLLKNPMPGIPVFQHCPKCEP